MEKREQVSAERRCKATTKRGTPCAATVVGSDGLCSAHSGRQDMRALGSRGGRSRRKGVAEQLPEAERASLRERLRRGLDPDLVVQTANEILAGENQTARGNMIRFLADLELYRKDGGEEDRAAQMKRAGAEARHHLAVQLDRLARHREDRQARDLLDELTAWLEDEAVDMHPDLQVIVGDISSERAERVFEQLEKDGLLVRKHRLEELVEERAQERLAALRAEHGIPA
jgi:hypothetical protein